MKIDLVRLNEEVDNGNVYLRLGSSGWNSDLAICNYSKFCQFEGNWNEITYLCRGLVIDINTGEIVAKSFTKFFNWSEHQSTSGECDYAEPLNKDDHSYITVYEKMDGSIGIVYWYDGEWRLNTRSTFHTNSVEIGERGYQILLGYDLDVLDKDCTYTFEIVFPENRIVVNYGDQEGLYLIGANRKTDGGFVEVDIDDVEWPHKPAKYSFDSMEDVMSSEQAENKEGYVVLFDLPHPKFGSAYGNFRVKFKFDWYLERHHLMTRFSEYKLWEIMKDGNIEAYDYILSIADPDVKEGIIRMAHNLEQKYQYLYKKYRSVYFKNRRRFATRKSFAAWALTTLNSNLLFRLYDGNLERYSEEIWELAKPEKTHGFFISDLIKYQDELAH